MGGGGVAWENRGQRGEGKAREEKVSSGIPKLVGMGRRRNPSRGGYSGYFG